MQRIVSRCLSTRVIRDLQKIICDYMPDNPFIQVNIIDEDFDDYELPEADFKIYTMDKFNINARLSDDKLIWNPKDVNLIILKKDIDNGQFVLFNKKINKYRNIKSEFYIPNLINCFSDNIYIKFIIFMNSIWNIFML